MDSSHFSTLINDFKPGIFGALNEKKEELLLKLLMFRIYFFFLYDW